MGHDSELQRHHLQRDLQLTGCIALLCLHLSDTQTLAGPLRSLLPLQPGERRALAELKHPPSELGALDTPSALLARSLDQAEQLMIRFIVTLGGGRHDLETDLTTSSDTLLTPTDKENQPWRDALRGWWQLREVLRSMLMISNARLVLFHTRAGPKTFPWDAQMLCGLVGLARSLKGFEPNRGRALSTYAFPWIAQKIERARHDNVRALRIPIHRLEDRRKLLQVMSDLREIHGRAPSAQEIRGSLYQRFPSQTWSKRRIVGLRRQYIPPAGPSWYLYTGTRLLDLLIDPSRPIPAQRLPLPPPLGPTPWLRAAIEESLAIFVDKARNRDILRRRFGLGLPKGETLEEIGFAYMLTRERIRQVQAKALERLIRRWRYERPENAVWLEVALLCTPLPEEDDG